jgi:hypothetical protein
LDFWRQALVFSVFQDLLPFSTTNEPITLLLTSIGLLSSPSSDVPARNNQRASGARPGSARRVSFSIAGAYD